MKNKRVGTISMAIVLIGFGVLLFLAQINQLSAVELAMKLWPMILILLGGEVLWYSFKSKDEENVKIRYDVFSVFIVIVILSVNVGIYGLLEFGLIDSLKAEITSTTFNYELPLEEYMIDSSIEKIVINAPRYHGFKIRTGKVDKVITSGSINIRSESEENVANKLEQNIISINKSGNTMYLTVKDWISSNHNIQDLNLIIPDDKEIEVNGGNDLYLIMENINKDVLIDNVHGINLRVGKNSNAKIETISNYEQGHEQELKGNVKWNTTQLGDESNPKYKGELIYGDGTNSLNIINSYDITVNEI
jgi:hypothetical protein